MFFFFQAEDGIRDVAVTGVQTCALPICPFFWFPSSPSSHSPVVGRFPIVRRPPELGRQFPRRRLPRIGEDGVRWNGFGYALRALTAARSKFERSQFPRIAPASEVLCQNSSNNCPGV